LTKKKRVNDIAPEVRETPEYSEGDADFANFVDVDDCPYGSSGKDNATNEEASKRLSWMAGWYDARAKAKFPKLFDPDHPEFVKEAKSEKEPESAK